MSGSANRFYQRLQEAWQYKAPSLVTVPYWFALAGQLPLWQTLLAMAASYTTIAGIAGFGYFLNDYTDINQDAKAGKPNSIALLTAPQRAVALLIILLVALLPWLYLPLGWLNLPFLLGQFGLFMAYSLPPVRLKERGVAGVIADALYAHVNPAVLAALTFYLLLPQPLAALPAYLALLAYWQLMWGVNNILRHQIQDAPADTAAKVSTFALQAGIGRVNRLLNQLLLPAEAIVYLAFLFFLAQHGLGWAWAGGCMAAGMLQAALLAFNRQLPGSSAANKLFFILHQQYLVWLPYTLLLVLVSRQAIFMVLLALHVLLFWQSSRQIADLFSRLCTFFYRQLPLPRYTLSQILGELRQKIARIYQNKQP